MIHAQLSPPSVVFVSQNTYLDPRINGIKIDIVINN